MDSVPKLLREEDFTSFQRSLHFPPSETSSDAPSELAGAGILHSLFTPAPKLTTWYDRQAWTELPWVDTHQKASQENVVQLNYKVEANPHHALSAVSLGQSFPALRARPGYKIRWLHNIGRRVFDDISLSVNKMVPIRTSGSAIASLIEFHETRRDTEMFQRGMGNRVSKDPEGWASETPAFTTLLLPPWDLNRFPNKSFPLLYFGDRDTIQIQVVRRSVISNLVEVIDTDTQDIVPFSSDVVEIVDTDPMVRINQHLKKPQVHVKYTRLTEMEIMERRCFPTSSLIESSWTFESAPGSTEETVLTLPADKLAKLPPIHTLYWQVENLDRPDVPIPILERELILNEMIILKDTTEFGVSLANALCEFDQVPSIGYECHSFAADASRDSIKPEHVINGGSLRVRVQNNKVRYRLVVVAVFTANWTYSNFAKDEESRVHSNCTFQVLTN